MKSFSANTFTFALYAIVSYYNFVGVLVVGNTESPGEMYQEELETAIEIYKNFSDAVFGRLSDIGENTTESESEAVDDGVSVASLLGISYILASTSEHVWPLSFPVFDSIMGNLSWNVMDAFDTVLLQMKETLNFVTVMFVPLSHNTTSKGKSLIEFIAVDFEEDDATVPIINEKILGSTNGLIQSSYIQDGVLIPSSTQAIFINVANLNLRWKTPWISVGKSTFNKNEKCEMLEFQGEIYTNERDSEIDVFIFFENNKSGLAFRMPKDISTDRSVANIEEMTMANPKNVTLQIPLMNYTLRSKYNLNDDNSCEFQKEDNVLQILDVLTYTFFGPSYFQVVAVSGAQIINVEQFQEEIRQQSDAFNKASNVKENTTVIYATEAKTGTNLDSKYDVNENMDDTDFDYLETEENSQIKEYDSAEKKSSKNEEKNESINQNDGAIKPSGINERLIIFNRPFTWMLFDEYQVPIVAGIVTSLQSPEEEAPPNYSYLGMETWKNVPYFQCF